MIFLSLLLELLIWGDLTDFFPLSAGDTCGLSSFEVPFRDPKTQSVSDGELCLYPAFSDFPLLFYELWLPKLALLEYPYS